MKRIKCVTDNRTIPAGFHPAIPYELTLPIRQVVEIPDEALDAVVELGGICVLPDPEPELLDQVPTPTTQFHLVPPEGHDSLED